ncbi:Cobyrinic acid A,C-diamide synthase [Stanieria cyanosphaera PCC 7437]|uniref:Cobyrinate a,c-diamide synthase n=1 Tax=Stanieria cyanosphaera (strain ATCC 29371 / PCC 7437) TaxID=111780 RepID=K9XXU9_STAC7|nr:cobyrinate a,c-diamide synthase [Stanieria cyanosphaera]AFZ36931.1 Cobyrinic acid A,C-diamide synthase [Stanieria cyanosphaera PCC 7437]
MTVVIAGDRSGVGKTTITLAMLAYLSQPGKKIQAFKVGPDYIDPMFHQAVTGKPSRNLDPILTSETYVQSCFTRHCQDADYVVVEGVMGLFDGIARKQRGNGAEEKWRFNDYGSTAHIARLLDLPILLVLDCSRLSTSIAAIVHGYRTLDPKLKIAGVILNRVASDRHLELLKQALTAISIPILGVVRRQDQITIPDRHLGLIPTEELQQLNQIFDRLAHLAKTSFNWHHLLLLLSPSASVPLPSSPLPLSPKAKIAVARDRAFNFYYQDNFDILSQLGAELIFWSPLEDENLPKDIQGFYFGGGFPEVFAEQLSANQIIIQQVHQAIKSGLPTYAECGGLMYLCQQLIDFEQKAWQMVGIIPSHTIMSDRLILGYRQATALQDSPLIFKNQTIEGHEFHRSQITSSAAEPLWHLRGYHSQNQRVMEGFKIFQLHASYLHLHFGENKFLAQNFIQCCSNQKN